MKRIARDILLSCLVIMLLVMMTAPVATERDRMFLVKNSIMYTSEDSMIPSNVTLEGTVIDNYANISYQMVFDNNESEIASEIYWDFELQAGVRLSNISIMNSNLTYWGRVLPEQEAITTYNESVEANKSALLVIRTYNGYQIRFNLENNSIATISVYVEGLLTRKLGLYSLVLPISKEFAINTAISLDLAVISNFGALAGYAVRGLPSFIATDLTNGIHIHYSSTLTSVDEIRMDYALDRQIGGSQLLTYTNGTDQFFVYLLAPSITEITDRASRQYVFVLDRSGSMYGVKISQAKGAFNAMVETLLSNDVFNLVSFDSTIQTLWSEPRTASLTNINAAQTWVNSIEAGDMTNFHGAALTGLNMMQPGENVKVMFILSDGLPTAGTIQDTSGILSAIREANELDVSISTVAFGSDADENLMANIAVQNNGFFALIQPNDEAADEIMSFYQEFATPIANSYSIEFTGPIDVNTLMPLRDSPFFNGTEVLVSGRYGSSMSVSTSIDYTTGTESYSNSAGAASTENKHIERIWAQQRISFLLRCIQLHGENSSLRDEIVSIGMYYGIIVQGYTALILTAYDVNEESSSDYGIYPAPVATGTTGGYPVIAGGGFNSLGFVPIIITSSVLIIVAIILGRRAIAHSH
ncbi:MAG: VWA domain-containing protein [Candidatus Thorarchaeota archaeon]|nr:VWA domain-containing protein [Candidatus Thorarchaeota archaeon]